MMKNTITHYLALIHSCAIFFLLTSSALGNAFVAKRVTDSEQREVCVRFVQDNTNRLHIAYSRGSGTYHRCYSRLTDSLDAETYVGDGIIQSIAISTNNSPVILCLSSNTACVYQKESNVWTSISIPNAYEATMDVDTNGVVHILYANPHLDSDGLYEILYCKYAEGMFSSPLLLENSYSDHDDYKRHDFIYDNPIIICGKGNTVHTLTRYYINKDQYPYSPVRDRFLSYVCLSNRLEITRTLSPNSDHYMYYKTYQNATCVDESNRFHVYCMPGPYLAYCPDASEWSLTAVDPVPLNTFALDSSSPRTYLANKALVTELTGPVPMKNWTLATNDVISVDIAANQAEVFVVASLTEGDNSDIFLFRLFDYDEDGLPDDWEDLYGLDSENHHDALADPDHDDMTTYDEYVAGTDPTNAASYFEITGAHEAISWRPSSSNRYYTVQSTTSLFAEFTNCITLTYPVDSFGLPSPHETARYFRIQVSMPEH